MDEQAFAQALEDLTQDGSFAEAMERLYLIAKIETGLKEAQAGRLVPQREVWERMRSWVM